MSVGNWTLGYRWNAISPLSVFLREAVPVDIAALFWTFNLIDNGDGKSVSYVCFDSWPRILAIDKKKFTRNAIRIE